MFGISKKTAVKASLVALASTAVSLAAALIFVPMLGGTPDGPGFWMSVVCPLVIAWPASAFQFSQNEKIRLARDQMAVLHQELDRVHHELMAAHAALQHKSRIDGLTGGLNRETFFALLDTASHDDQPSALLIADADHFKRINDEFGHQCGDDALRGIAEAIAASMRPQDFWGRIGGEEFAIFLPGADKDSAHMIADMIRSATAAASIIANGEPVPVSVSIGGACTVGGFDPKALFIAADRRLYKAKHAGRNRVDMDCGKRESAAA
jgi:diguanylate cyclase (GGDEF)-like protein